MEDMLLLKSEERNIKREAISKGIPEKKKKTLEWYCQDVQAC